jgi:hypothetical protein
MEGAIEEKRAGRVQAVSVEMTAMATIDPEVGTEDASPAPCSLAPIASTGSRDSTVLDQDWSK